MKKCEWCKKSFDEEEAREIFEDRTQLEFANLHKCLCGNCASDLIADEETGIYFETCEKCGTVFDLIEAEAEFRDYGASYRLREGWGLGQILCVDCAIERIERDESKYI